MTTCPAADRRLLSLAATAVGAVGVVYATTLVLCSYFGALPFGRLEFVPALIVAAATFSWSLHLFRSFVSPGLRRPGGKGRIDFGRAANAAPAAVVPISVVLGVFGFINLAWFIFGSADGGPKYDRAHHRYLIENHGTTRVVSKATFESAQTLMTRGLLGLSLLFACLGLPFVAAHWCARTGGMPSSPAQTAGALLAQGRAYYPLKGTPVDHPDWSVRLRADERGLSLRTNVKWLGLVGTSMSDSLLPEEAQRRGDWYAEWSDVQSATITSGPTGDVFALRLADGDGFYFATRPPARLTEFADLLGRLGVPGVPNQECR